MPELIMIAALGEKNELGKDNDLLWHLPDDFKRFKQLTMGHAMIMGRKTFESFPKPLPKRKHIILTRDCNYKVDHEDCMVVHSLEEAIAPFGADEQVYVIGGGEIYKLCLPNARILELTRVHATFPEADAFFPDFDPKEWRIAEKQEHSKDDRHRYAFTYVTYKRA